MADKTAVFSLGNRIESPVYAHDIFAATDAGQSELRAGRTALPAEALAILVMLDGKLTAGDIEHRVPQISPEASRKVLRALVAAGLAREVTMAEAGDIGVDFAAFFDAAS